MRSAQAGGIVAQLAGSAQNGGATADSQPSTLNLLLLAFHKPYGTLSQFTPESGSRWRTLAEFDLPKNVYPVGRLDADSEGLLLLTDEPGLNSRLLHPTRGHRRTYWAQVERVPSAEALAKLERGVTLGAHRTLPCRAWLLDPQPAVPPRHPPIRFRKNVADCWVALELIEGKNHQVRKMTAAIGHPTLRLVRMKIGELELGTLVAGEWRALDDEDRQRIWV